MTTKFSSRFNANYNRMKRLNDAVLNVYTNACRFCWLSSFVNTAYIKLRESDDYVRLPQRDRQFIEGQIAAYCTLMKREYTHVYLCNDGKFRAYLDGYQPYDYPSSNNGRTLIEDTCILVWKAKPNHVAFVDEKALKVISDCHVTFAKQNESVIDLGVLPKAY